MKEATIIAPAEAWEAVERLDIDITHNGINKEWCASVSKPRFQVGWGSTPLEAVGNLLMRLGGTAPFMPAGIQNGLKKVEELEQGREMSLRDGRAGV